MTGTVVITGTGLTVTILVNCEPTHPFAVGVIVIVTVPAVLLAFVSVQDGIGFVVPLGAAPVIPSVELVTQL